MEVDFRTAEDVLEIHAGQIVRHGGCGGVRDIGLLDAAVAMPKASFVGALLHAAIVEMAAACLFHSVQNHPFVGGDM
jgi:death-on-curing protein